LLKDGWFVGRPYSTDTFAVVEACSVQFDRYKCGAQSMNYYET
jgi:hypothetical protein